MMQINVTGEHIEVTPALRNLTIEKMDKLERHFDRIASIDVMFNIENLMQVAKGSVHMSKSDVHARAESDDLYTAIDELVHKLDRQLAKQKGKRLDHRDHKD